MSAPLKDYLEPELSPARLSRNRSAIESRLARGSTPMFGALFGAGMAVAIAVALTIGWRDEPSTSARPVWAVAPDARFSASSAPASVALDDGSVIDLRADTSLRGLVRTPRELELELERGEATFDVSHDPERAFRIACGGVTIRVIGTRFDVSREAGRVAVRVERGRVEVARGEERFVLGPGEDWSGDDQTEVPEPPPSESTEGDETTGDGELSERPASRDRRAVESDRVDAAQALFEAARAARRDGRPDRAAALFAELVEQHPGDARAGLAAFELGRIRLDVMHDVAGSIEALERALDLSPHGGFRQDALARLVVLYDRRGDHSRCREAQSRYLSDYPDGVHLAEVASHCD